MHPNVRVRSNMHSNDPDSEKIPCVLPKLLRKQKYGKKYKASGCSASGEYR
jgi:hypothetical protein